MNISSKRAKYVAITGLVLSIIFYVSCCIIGGVTGAFAAWALGWQNLAGVFIWFVLVIVFHQRSLAEQEKLDMKLLAQSKTGETIFQDAAEKAGLFAVAQKRLEFLEKWFVPLFAILIACYQIGVGSYLLNKVSQGADRQLHLPQLGAVFMVAIAFISFLISRYAGGMSTQQQWKPLRAGGSYLLGTAILSFAMAICLALGQFKFTLGITILGWVIPILMIVLGVEIALNLVMDIYRPRISGQYSRSAFDSRLLGIISEPGGILRTFASAIDYQFGFKVSQTWFYRLFIKAVIPLVLFSIVTLYSLSCVVVVGPAEEALIEHYGSFDDGGRVVGPGIWAKLPFPFEKAYKYATARIQQINIGFVEGAESEKDARKPLLWGEKHYEAEYNLLVSAESSRQGDSAGAVPVSLLRAAVPVQYRIKDLKAFVYNQNDTKRALEAICYRQLTRLAAGATIEVQETASDAEVDDPTKMSLLGAGRGPAAAYLTEQIQNDADAAGLGVEIVFVGLQGVHPPTEVAKDYEAVVGSVQKKQASILVAMAEKNRILTALSGSIDGANRLYELADKYQSAKNNGDQEAAERLSEEVNRQFGAAQGDIFKILSEAGSYAFERAVLAKATGERFTNQVLAYQASPNIYKRELYLATLEEALKTVRKYVVVAEADDRQVFIIDLQEQLTPSLYDMPLEILEQNK
ncbi:MAG: SPFH domain-containing protein [Planctomycetota bacterium]|jgi:regulator of protease activity HflC (stomatin/prohibitin superfamily)